MADLACWMRSQFDRHNMTQAAASVHAGGRQAIVADILNKGHIATVCVLFRLVGCSGTGRSVALKPGPGNRGDSFV